MKNMHIAMLPVAIREQVMQDIRAALTMLNMEENELVEVEERAINSRLCDLEDTIDLNKYA